jgi:hypothetical protein
LKVYPSFTAIRLSRTAFFDLIVEDSTFVSLAKLLLNLDSHSLEINARHHAFPSFGIEEDVRVAAVSGTLMK